MGAPQREEERDGSGVSAPGGECPALCSLLVSEGKVKA